MHNSLFLAVLHEDLGHQFRKPRGWTRWKGVFSLLTGVDGFFGRISSNVSNACSYRNFLCIIDDAVLQSSWQHGFAFAKKFRTTSLASCQIQFLGVQEMESTPTDNRNGKSSRNDWFLSDLRAKVELLNMLSAVVRVCSRVRKNPVKRITAKGFEFVCTPLRTVDTRYYEYILCIYGVQLTGT